MFQSGVTILPDSSRADQALAGLAQLNMNLLQQENQEKSKQIEDFQKIVDRSFYPVYGEDRKGYLDLRDKLLNDAAKVYKSTGRINAKDYMAIQGNLKQLENYVAQYMESKQLISDSVKKVMFDTSGKIDKDKSFEKLNEISKMPLTDRVTQLNSGSWLVTAPFTLPINHFQNIASKFYTIRQEPVIGDKDAKTQKYPVTSDVMKLDEVKYTEALKSIWAVNGPSYQQQKLFKDEQSYIDAGLQAVSKEKGGNTSMVGQPRSSGSTKNQPVLYELRGENDEVKLPPIEVEGFTKYYEEPGGDEKGVNSSVTAESWAGTKLIGAKYAKGKLWGIVSKPVMIDQEVLSLTGQGSTKEKTVSKEKSTIIYVPWEDVEKTALGKKVKVQVLEDEFEQYRVK